MSQPAPFALDPFYPIVPDAGWVAHIATLGVRTVQLRFKSEDPDACKREVAASVCIADGYGDLTLIINDHWQAAIEFGAKAIHLGQEDLAGADVAAIKSAGLALGVSTHDDSELATALKTQPDYVALGPVFETKLKKMPWAPQGLDRVTDWKNKIGDIPLVAIGGLTPERATEVLNAGAASASVITDFMTAPDPTKRIKEWVSWSKQQKSS